MNTNDTFFCYQAAYAATGTTVRSSPGEKATDPLLPRVMASAGTKEALSPEEREERRWEELLGSPESQADMGKMAAKIETNVASGKSIKYVQGMNLAELFRA